MANASETDCSTWTDDRTEGGLDPLGMRSISVNPHERCLPGIRNATLRMRR